MAKKKTDTISISRDGRKKDIAKATWDSMVKNNATYGWRATSDIKDEVLDKDKEVESNQIKTLQSKVEDLTKENETLKTSEADKDKEVKTLQSKVEDLTKEVAELKKPAAAKDSKKA